MSLTDRLGQFFDVFSNRQKAHGPGYKPPTISRELHGRILLLYSEVISGRLNTRGWGYAEDHGAAFFAQMHQALRLLYGRANLAEQRQHSEAENGRGSTVRNVDRHVAQYAVTATAAAIVLLVHDMGK